MVIHRKSHIGYEVRRIAKENGVHLLKLPPHTTHLLQPLDLGVFNHLKRTWEPIVGQFTRQQVRLIKKADFPKLLAKMWLSFKPELAVAGFKMAGVVPFNNKAVPGSFLRPSEVFAGRDPLERVRERR